MRLSNLLAPTLRETPAEAEIASHQLMLRAGLMRKVAAGIYTFLPLGHRAVSNVERIIREEMDRAGAQELRLPIVQPAELWEETGRWAAYGEEMWRVKDRHGRLFCLGPTHEEIVTDLVRNEVSSYRQLPINLYQIQFKYRDEIRPRFGVMRAREFVMKDAYSFHRDEASLHETYARMYEAYWRIFTRCGLDFRPVLADSGAIGGSYTHEFCALADAGEAALVHCDACGYAANVERAEAAPAEPRPAGATPPGPAERVATPGVRSIPELAAFLGVEAQETAKTLFFWSIHGDGRQELLAVLVRGDRDVNEVKLKNHLGALHVQMAGADEVREKCGVPVGFAGPVGLKGVRLLADVEVMAAPALVVGANAEDAHLRNVQPGRDFSPGAVLDLRLVGPGDACPECGAPLQGRRGIEVGQVFMLGTKYSEAMGATFLDEHGQARPVIMGCYGIGVTRTVAAVIEQHHDADGIVWPASVAPYQAVVVPVNVQEEAQRRAAEDIYRGLQAAGVEAVLDDRDERPGVKFKDADLVGFPFRVTVGKTLAEGQVEVTDRRTRETRRVPLPEAAAAVRERLAAALAGLDPDRRPFTPWSASPAERATAGARERV